MGATLSGKPRGAVIAGIYNTRQARRLPDETTRSLTVTAILGALEDAWLSLDDVDGVSAGEHTHELVYDLRVGPAWVGSQNGISMVLEAAAAVEAGQADVVVVVSAQAGDHDDVESTAPWTRPMNEFVAPYGMFTAAEFALIARRHMETYGTTPEQLAKVAATIRNNGHMNTEAIYHGKGPFTVSDILESRMIADPFHLLDCATTSEGGAAVVVTTAERARDTRGKPIHVLAGAAEYYGPYYHFPPAWDLRGRAGRHPLGRIGEGCAARMFARTGLSTSDVDVLELYDPFSFEIIRQLEAFGFCGEGEGGAFVEEGHIDPGGRFPVTTDGGTMSFAHPGTGAQFLQRVIRGVQQLRGQCGDVQVSDAKIVLCSNAGAGALFFMTALLGLEQL